ncbi:hypothetical protein Hamer_G002606 [Homarus americanus]|uniref:Uncharacterized protein n=1 Tax=Homarus americanus TaxID=6706 RepID=A0A8J5K6K3_HOMAM|nr:hypothetical protein Hamer_G002606 [Homarus americanus]
MLTAHQWRVMMVAGCTLVAGACGNPSRKARTTQPVVQELVTPATTYTSVVSVYLWPRKTPLMYTEYKRNTNDEESDNLKIEGVKVPTLNCESDQVCWEKYSDPMLICVKGLCQCSPPSCWVYHYEITTTFTARDVFNCGTCGVLGSYCDSTITCDWPGECWDDNFCHCPRGENDNNICITTDSNWPYKTAIGIISLIIIITLIMIIHSCCITPPWRQQERWCCGLCPGASGFGDFPLSSTVSQNLEGGSGDGIVGAMALPSHLRHQRTLSISSSNGEANSTISSISTTVTNVSDVSTVGVDEARLTSLNADACVSESSMERGAVHPGGERIFTINLNVSSEMVNFQAPSEAGSSEAGSSVGSSVSCTHERCQLCLPKGPMTRPSTVPVIGTTSTGGGTLPQHSLPPYSVNVKNQLESTRL